MERKGPPNNFQQKQNTLAMINMIMKIMLDSYLASQLKLSMNQLLNWIESFRVYVCEVFTFTGEELSNTFSQKNNKHESQVN